MIRLVTATALWLAVAGEAPRYWPRFGGKRAVTTLDGTWEYGLFAAKDYPLRGGARLPEDFDSMDANFGPWSPLANTPNTTAVPSCMDVADPGYLGTRGVAMYRTSFQQFGSSRLQFQSCSFYCRVWVDGQEIGEHTAGGYVAFSLDVPASDKQIRELFVLADNRFNQTTAPMHTGGDFWHYGGIMRSVELHTLPEETQGPWPWRAYILPSAGMPFSHVDIEIILTDRGFTGEIDVALTFDSGSGPTLLQAMASEGRARIAGFPVPNPRRWSIASPELHVLEVLINEGAVSERFGLREFDVDPSSARLMVNGEILKLVGFNHHTQWPNTGASPTDAQLDSDIAMLKAAGTNYVRGAHYPQDPRWLDRCDAAGIVVWAETLCPNVKVANIQDRMWMGTQLVQLNEMLDNAMNHASIMTWGWFNEGPENKAEACPVYAACANLTRSRDPTRFTTWASGYKLKGQCFEYASLIAFNDYPKWYSDDDPTMRWNSLANAVRAGTSSSGKHTLGKPFVIGETGAGGIFEWNDNDTDVHWSLKYQSEIVSQDVDVALANNNISGITLWHFFDFKVADKQENNTHCDYMPDVYPPTCGYIEINGRPGGMNHKGVIDFWRRPKPIYSVVAAKYNSSTPLAKVV